MQQEDQTTSIGISLHCSGEEGGHIKLVVGDMQNGIFHLSLQQARMLATALIQHVHRADVSNSMKKAKQQPIQSAMERTGTHLSMPTSQQA